MKKVLLISLMLPCIAFGGVQIPEGSVKQESCGVSGYDARQKIWKFELINKKEFTVKNKVSSVGKVVSTGDVLFYATISTVIRDTSFEPATDDIARVAHKLFGPSSVALPKGTKLNKFATLTSPDAKTQYSLLRFNNTGTYTFSVAMKADGFLCSGEFISLGESLEDVSDDDNYQKEPLVKSESLYLTDTDTIAISLIRMDDMFATLGVKQLKDGQVVKQKEVQLDMMAGTFKIEGLVVTFERKDKSSLKIQAITEPTDFGDWLRRIKSNLLKQQ